MSSPSGPTALPVTPERIAKLRAFGLSEYAARAYLALLHLGTTEARDVAGLSKVPASKIYHVLDQLAEKGLVTVLPEFPRKYAPVPFADFLRRLHDEHHSAARAIREELPALLQAFSVEPERTSSDRGSVTLLRGRRNVHERGIESVVAAREQAVVLLTAGQTGAGATAWSEALADAEERGVDVRIVPRPTALPPDVCALAVDAARVLLVHAVPDDGHPSEGNDVGLVVEQEGLASFLVALLRSHASVGQAVPVDAPEDERAILRPG